MAEIKTELVLNLRGDLAEQLARTSRQVRQFSMQANRNLSTLGRASMLAGRGIDALGNKYMALATGGAGAAASKFVVDSQRRMTRLGIDASASSVRIQRLKRSLYDVAQASDIRADPGEMTAAIEAIVSKTGDLEFAEENLRNIGMTIQATGASGAAVGELMAEIRKMGDFNPAAVLTMLDTLNVQGKTGAFTLQNLAALGPRVVTAYSHATKGARSGVETLKEMGAALQVIRMGTGSSEQAATAFERVLGDLQDPAKIKKLSGMGIRVFDPRQPGAEVLRPINELLLEILEKSKGRRTILGEVFGQESIRAFNAINPERMKAFMDATGTGAQTMEDSARAANDAAGALQNLSTAAKLFADRNLSGGIQGMADALNTVDPDTGQKWLDLAGKIALAVAGIVGAKKLLGVGKSLANGAKYLLGPTATAALGTRIGAFSPTNPLPVLAVAGAGYAGVKTGEAIYDNLLQGTQLADALGGTLAGVLATLGSERARAAIDAQLGGFSNTPSPVGTNSVLRNPGAPVDLGGTLKIEIGVDGLVRLKQAQKNGPLDFDLRSGPLALGAGQ